MNNIKIILNPDRLRFTGEYRGGVMAGFGMGIAIMAIVMRHVAVQPYENVLLFGGMALAILGATIAHRVQRKRAKELNNRDQQPLA